MSVPSASLRVYAMRPIIVCLMIMGAVADAVAADARDFSFLNEPVLRGSEAYQSPRAAYQPGSPVYFRWQGLYVGGQVGRTMAGVQYKSGVSTQVSSILRNDIVLNHVQDWSTLPNDTMSGSTFGGFVGYNSQWDGEAVLGLEMNYNRASLQSAVTDSITRSFLDDTFAVSQHHNSYVATVSGSASVRITDFGTIRARGGWAAGQFMPYAFIGLAIGRADIMRSATVTYTRTDVPDPGVAPLPTFVFGPTTKTDVSNGTFTYGYAAGLGMDVALTPNIFVRGEWEWIQFTSFKNVDVHLNSARAALGVKF